MQHPPLTTPGIGYKLVFGAWRNQMKRLTATFAFLIALPAAAMAVPVTFTYNALPLKLVEIVRDAPNPADPDIVSPVSNCEQTPNIPISWCTPPSYTTGGSITIESSVFGGSLANLTIGGFGSGGRRFDVYGSIPGGPVARIDSLFPTADPWFRSTFFASDSSSFSFIFDSNGNIKNWQWGTNSYGYDQWSVSLSGIRYQVRPFNLVPFVEVTYQSDGPGTWTSSGAPSPVPVPPAFLALATGLAALGFAHRRKAGKKA
jgi:hypothetical protein